MPIPKSQFKLLDGLDMIVGNVLIYWDLKDSVKATARKMVKAGLLSKKSWAIGRVRATQKGLRSWAAEHSEYERGSP
jgi:hypothetical protein